LNSSNNLSNIFHMFIIASFLLSMGGCGYKKSPYYQKEAPIGDKNVEFIVEDKKFPKNIDINESCE